MLGSKVEKILEFGYAGDSYVDFGDFVPGFVVCYSGFGETEDGLEAFYGLLGGFTVDAVGGDGGDGGVDFGYGV